MQKRLARLFLRLVARFAPGHLRARWSEEWLAETDRALDERRRGTWRKVAGAPIDALLYGRRRASVRLPRGARGTRTVPDVRDALRHLRRRPLQAATIVLCLGLGMSGTVATFSVFNAFLFGPVPGIADRSRLSNIHLGQSAGAIFGDGASGWLWRSGVTRAQFDILAAEAPDDAIVAGEHIRGLAVRLGDRSLDAAAAFVTPRYFEALGTTPVAGRLLGPGDGAAPMAVISNAFWLSELTGRPDVIGEPIDVGGVTLTIAGVAPPRFTGWTIVNSLDADQDHERAPALWLPFGLYDLWPATSASPRGPTLDTLVRHPPSTTREELEQQLSRLTVSLARAFDPDRPVASPWALALSRHGWSPGDTTTDTVVSITLLMLAPFVVLLIACANVANLQLAVATERLRELSVRLSLGATRGQVARLLGVEIGFLALAGAGCAWLATRLILWYFASVLPLPVPLDVRVVAMSAALLLFVVVVAGLAPGWLLTGRATAAVVRENAAAATARHGRLRGTLVVGQVALSLVLLIVGALFARAFDTQHRVLTGSTDGLLVARVGLGELSGTPADADRFAADLLALLSDDGRAAAAGISDLALFEHLGAQRRYRLPGEDFAHLATVARVTPGYLEAIGAQLTAGRSLTSADAGSDVVAVSDTMAGTLASGGSPVGLTINLQEGRSDSAESTRPHTVIGVVADVPDVPRGRNPTRHAYLPLATAPATFWLAVRTAVPGELSRHIEQTAVSLEPRGPRLAIEPAAALVARETMASRLLAEMSGILGVLALGLATAGLYGVMGYAVALRTREIGIRMAVGARPEHAVRLVLRQTLGLVGAGVAAGGVVAVLLLPALRSGFRGLAPLEPIAAAPAVVVPAAAALVAALVPARRAARINPVDALRRD
jgi:predicted permease